MTARWSIPLDQIARDASTSLEEVARNVTDRVFRGVALRSPVDTGRFRANWNVSRDVPDYATTEATDQDRMFTEIAKAKAMPVGGVVWMSNGLPYARRLEEGYSKQAPTGMVATTVAEFTQTVAEAKRGG